MESTDGTRERFDLVVGADGVRSRVRNLVFGSDEVRWINLGCRTASYILPRRVAGVDPDSFVSLTAAGVMAAVYPLRADRMATFFAYGAPPGLNDHSAEACRRDLEATFRGHGSILDILLDRFPKDDDVYFDEIVQIAVKPWSHGRVVLLGDACGCVSLLAGQGASMAVAGALVLAEEIGRQGSSVAQALDRYETRLRRAVESRQESGRRNVAWLLTKSAFRARLRDRMMSWSVQLPFGKFIGRRLGNAPLPDAQS